MSIARSLIIIIAGLPALFALAGCRENTPPSPTALRLSLDQPDELVVGGGPEYPFGLALAPDGRRLVFPAARTHRAQYSAGDEALAKSPTTQLWLRDLSTNIVSPLAGTTGGLMPFWSPDGQTIGFFADGKMHALRLNDGSVSELSDAPSPRGAVWHTNGDILFAPRTDGALMRRTADGTVGPFTSLESGEASHRWPHVVGDRHVVFFVRAHESTRQGIWLASLNEPASRKRLVNSEAEGLAIDDSLIYASGGALVAQRINLESLALTGRSALLGSPVGRGTEHQLFATTSNDVLLFGVPASGLRELRWVDRTGATLGALGEPMLAWDVRLSPLGSRAAVARVDPQLNTLDIWTYDEQRPVPRRLSPAIDADDSPAWSRDGSRIAWVSGRRAVTMRDSRGERPDVTIRKFDNGVRVTDWSPDGRWIVLSESRAVTGSDIVLLPAENAQKAESAQNGAQPRAYAQAPFNETHGTVSPDGRWLAYASDESGAMEIYVDAFPTPGRRTRVSVGGGTEPRWSRDGTRIFFRRVGEIHLATLRAEDGKLAAVSSERLFDAGTDIRSFDIAPNGERLLLNVPAREGLPRPLTVIVHPRSLLPSAP